MQGDRQDQSEFTIERGRERDAGAGRSSPRGAASAPQGETQSGQAQFDLGGETERQSESGMPERLRRKYYVAEAGAGDVAKIYVDPRGEYLAFKVSTDRLATRLEDAGVVRDMVSVAQHRGWKEVELLGSHEFRRTGWIEASVRGLAVRGYEPDPVDLAALSFRTKADVDPARSQPQSQQPAAQPSQAVSAGPPTNGSAFKIDALPLLSSTPDRPLRSAGQRRADIFRSAHRRRHGDDDVVKAARSQMAAIEGALTKAVRDPALRQPILAFANDRIAQELERGNKFKLAELSTREMQERSSADSTRKSHPNSQGAGWDR